MACRIFDGSKTAKLRYHAPLIRGDENSMGGIKVLFKRADAYKDSFKHSQCLLLISVGQESHEGERFKATVDLINSSFESCIISLYDSLQRHTMALDSTEEPDFFHEISVKEGDLWLERNAKFYNKLSGLKKISRWDVWLSHPNYLARRNELVTLINNDPSYKVVFDNTIDTYLARYCKRFNDLNDFDFHRARQLCFDYLLEECTVLCLWPELRCQFELYPNRHNDAIEETRKRFIEPNYSDLLRAVAIGFRNAKQIKPQNFELLKDLKEEFIS